jgi:hypothetical protein
MLLLICFVLLLGLDTARAVPGIYPPALGLIIRANMGF